VGLSTGTPHTYTPKKTAEYEEALRWLFKSQCKEPFAKGVPLKVRITFFVPASKRTPEWPVTRPDLDNYVKAIMDPAKGILWHDDSQVVVLTAMKAYASGDGWSDFQIEAM